MGASAAETPTSPDEQPAPGTVSGLRASDAERDEVAARLRDEFVAGRLSHDTFLYRMNAVLEARQRADLPPLIADLPADKPRAARLLSAVGRLRGAWSRLYGPRQATPPRTSSARGALIRGTLGISATGDPNSDPDSPLSLQFPRGAYGQFSIGRDASCDLAIADMTVSRRHATLERTSDGWLLSDLESTNGTRVNGWRVRGKVAVRPGDLVCFGNLVAVFAREDTVPPGTVSPESAPAPDRP
jgi:Domain of unknown function (DUF1707)/FHA domain